eukprot:Protomagalhaensia_wolfi_Nauph_80__4512@NODE_462_length_2475_cov_151_987685_g348_i0_p2_GENE_NODE_462_length_2475_cov_151_987685_g348_i0NODE_462_length_2475_cov_151_987685_g348_i0_p2_ORF_typecomplete_len289_score33_35_NODE_462_length_2475_cov_151_987685_g348_i014772343
MHFQVRLPCIDVGVCKSEDCSQYPFSTGQYVPSDNQCGSEIPAIAGLPGANECCCPKAQLHLLKSTQALARNSKQLELDGIWSHLLGVASNTPTDGEADSSLSASSSTPALDSTQCTQNRKCQFLCCSSQSKFCGSQCCQSDELCGQRVVDQRPCCVAPFPRIIPSPNAPPNLNISLHRLAQNSCCAFGVGLNCGSGASCCLDSGIEGCMLPELCPSSWWSFHKALMLILWPIFLTLTLIGGVTVATGIWRIVGESRASRDERESILEGDLTSAGVYGQTSSVLSHSD